ncbi:hypothetical protein SAMN05421858_4810 [Haladaptatus litoreus]|uniref:Uncharacterized protein n=1 Tax=Haladaptatus litoreus TaxID=553468 RepID=A0A1N7F8D9_9EURY|nr:hypothetical protein SAMN05421858_4810 [Haladaptatus litoreus]
MVTGVVEIWGHSMLVLYTNFGTTQVQKSELNERARRKGGEFIQERKPADVLEIVESLF